MPRADARWRASRRLLAALGLAAVVTAAASAETGQRFAPAGVLVRSGSDMLHLLCTGEGSPAIVLEAGLGGNYLDWSLVQPALSRSNRVCSYDRAGAGWSEPSARPRTVDNIADELRRLIVAAGVGRPVILVGHSFGGLLALHYACIHPDEVAGLVLLDPTHPDQFERFQAEGITLPTDAYAVVTRTPPAAAIYGLPPPLHRLAIHLAASTKARDAAIQEMIAMRSNADVVRAEGYRHIPARLVVHGNHEWDHVYPDGRMEAAWLRMQTDLATALGAPPPIVATGSGHQIPLDQPELVVETVRDLARSLRP